MKIAQEYDSAQRTLEVQEKITAANKNCFRCDKTNHKQENYWTLRNPSPPCGKTGHIKNKCRPKQEQQHNKPKKKENAQKSTSAVDEYNCGPKTNVEL